MNLKKFFAKATSLALVSTLAFGSTVLASGRGKGKFTKRSSQSPIPVHRYAAEVSLSQFVGCMLRDEGLSEDGFDKFATLIYNCLPEVRISRKNIDDLKSYLKERLWKHIDGDKVDGMVTEVADIRISMEVNPHSPEEFLKSPGLTGLKSSIDFVPVKRSLSVAPASASDDSDDYVTHEDEGEDEDQEVKEEEKEEEKEEHKA